MRDLQEELRANPSSGTFLRNNTYKIRFAIKSNSRGKSDGGRVLYYRIVEQFTEHNAEPALCIYLLYIWDKKEMNNISDSYFADLISEVETIINAETSALSKNENNENNEKTPASPDHNDTSPPPISAPIEGEEP